MTITAGAKILFSTFDVSGQVFFTSALSVGIVNLKPLIPGHVMLISKRAVPRLMDLDANEISDLFQSVQRVGKVIEQAYGAQGLNISVQDGSAAGQSVPHVHVHILPRKATDFGGKNDEVYPQLEESEARLERDLQRVQQPRRSALEVPKDEDRRPRTLAEMEAEAQRLASFFDH